MAYRLYITPSEGDPFSEQGRHPKYFVGLSWAAMDYGFQPLFLVAADLTSGQDATIVGNSDVIALPFDLSGTLQGGQVQAARNALEAALIPAQWVNAQMSWQTVARMIAGMFTYMQRLNVIVGNDVLIDSSTKLNIQFSAIPANIQQGMLDAATSLGYTVIDIQPNTQIRVILEDFATQWGNKPFGLGGMTF